MLALSELRQHYRAAEQVRQTPQKSNAVFWRKLRSLRQRSQQLPSIQRQTYARNITHAVLEGYWQQLDRTADPFWTLPPAPEQELNLLLDEASTMFVDDLVAMIAQQNVVTAGYKIGEVYTALLPEDLRSQFGVYYTPPALTSRLMSLLTELGVDWSMCRTLDPACGGGAFLAPVALRKVATLIEESPEFIFEHICTHLSGYEIDPFSAWMSQSLLEAALLDLCQVVGRRLPPMVQVCDTLQTSGSTQQFDLIIGNPPYGRMTLSKDLRQRYQRSLYGHANIYGLFMDLSTQLVRLGGMIALITPTGFLGGEYFKALRSVMAADAPPVAIDLVVNRNGVFSDVLQETLLSVYRRGVRSGPARVHLLSLLSDIELLVSPAGQFELPAVSSEPWLLPRTEDQSSLVARLRVMPQRLSDYGYKVSTGPLVWNRHKVQLLDQESPGAYPVVWAESVTSSGQFFYRTEKKNHQPFIKLRPGDEWLLVDTACVLLQRTTAKEQARRLIAAELPASFIAKHGAVVVENHLNMVKPTCPTPAFSLRLISALLNSETVDSVFRCISGSVAVSASEMEALPLPSPEDMQMLEALLQRDADADMLEQAIRRCYLGEESHAPA